MFVITVENGKNSTYPHRENLYIFGLRRKSQRWTGKTSDPDTAKKIRQYCRKNGLYCSVIDERFLRSSEYRKKFFRSYKSKNGYFRCAYCGKKLTASEVAVDHIIPIGGRRRNRQKISKLLLSALRISDINDVKNLTPSCKSCNSRKSDRISPIYLMLGFTGRSYIGAFLSRVFTRGLLFAILAGFFVIFVINIEKG